MITIVVISMKLNWSLSQQKFRIKYKNQQQLGFNMILQKFMLYLAHNLKVQDFYMTFFTNIF